MGIIVSVSHTLEVVFCSCGKHCNLTIKRDNVKIATTPEQPTNQKLCSDTLDAMAALHNIPIEEHIGMLVQLEEAFRRRVKEEREKVVVADPLTTALVGLTSDVLTAIQECPPRGK